MKQTPPGLHDPQNGSQKINEERLWADGVARYDRSDEVIAYVRARRNGDHRAYDPYRYRRAAYRTREHWGRHVLTLVVAFVAFAAVALTAVWVIRP